MHLLSETRSHSKVLDIDRTAALSFLGLYILLPITPSAVRQQSLAPGMSETGLGSLRAQTPDARNQCR